MKRLMKEYKDLMTNAPSGILAAPENSENLFKWRVVIAAPSETAYEFGVFEAVMQFPQDYPLSPPTMRFVSQMYHPNVYPDGRVCISILHAPGDDPMHYESASERWSPGTLASYHVVYTSHVKRSPVGGEDFA